MNYSRRIYRFCTSAAEASFLIREHHDYLARFLQSCSITDFFLTNLLVSYYRRCKGIFWFLRVISTSTYARFIPFSLVITMGMIPLVSDLCCEQRKRIILQWFNTSYRQVDDRRWPAQRTAPTVPHSLHLSSKENLEFFEIDCNARFSVDE